MGYNKNMEIAETSIFTNQINKIISEEDYRNFQNQLILSPKSGVLIRGTGGIRKIRVQASGRGKRGGARVLYYYFIPGNRILMLLIYKKNTQDDLTPKQKKILSDIINSEEVY